MDEEGTRMQGTFFKEMVEKYSQMLKLGAVYTISGGVIKPTPQKFSNNTHENCIVFDRMS